MNAYRLNYNWYEGEHEDCLIVTKLDSEPFEQLLKAGIAEVSTYPEESMVFNIPKIFTVRCLPQAYSLLKEYLESHECHAIEFFKESKWKDQLAMAMVLLVFVLRLLQIK